VIVNRALIREVLQTSVAVTFVILSIFVVVRSLGFLQQAVRGDVPVEAVLTLVVLKTIGYLDVIIPLMMYIAILMVLGRWNRDNEMIILAASGVSPVNFLKPLSILALTIGGVVALFSFWLTPMAIKKGFDVEQEYRNRSEVAGVIPGTFMETKKGRGVYFVEDFDRKADRYENVFVYKSSFGKEGVVVSRYAFQRNDEVTGDRFLVLRNGTRYEGSPGRQDYRIVDFETYALRIEPKSYISSLPPVKGRPTTVIFGDQHPALISEWHWRIAKVIMVPVLAVFALTFSFVNPRQGRLPSMIMAFMAYFLYTNVLGFSVAMLSKSRFDPNVGLWWVHAIFLFIAAVLLYRRQLNQPLLPLPRFRLPRPRFRSRTA
jgi:lipopolysaccharide export system permease protein